MAWIYRAPSNRHRESVGGGAVWGCRTVGAMDGAIEPQGWVYGVSCSPTPSRQTISNPEPHWLWALPLRVQGAALPN